MGPPAGLLSVAQAGGCTRQSETCSVSALHALPVAPLLLWPRVDTPPPCLAPWPWLMVFPVTVQPTLRGPARPPIKPFLRAKFAFPKFPSPGCAPLIFSMLNLSVTVPILRAHIPGTPEGLLNCYMLVVSPA